MDKITTDLKVAVTLYSLQKDKEYVKSIREATEKKSPQKEKVIARFSALEDNYNLSLLMLNDLAKELEKYKKRESIVRDELFKTRRKIEKLKVINERLLLEIEKQGL